MDYKNSIGEKFAKSAKELFSWNNMDLPSIVELLKSSVSASTKVLDLGCGDGRILPHLKNLGLSENYYHGIDIDEDLIKIATAEYPKAKFEVNDVSKSYGQTVTNRESKKDFELIISIHVLHYFSKAQLQDIFQNCAKSQKTGGKMVFLVAHPIRWVADDLSQYFKGGVRVIPTTWGTQMEIHLNSLETYLSTALEAGYVITKYREPVPNPESEQIDPVEYNKYLKQPSRLLVELTKI